MVAVYLFCALYFIHYASGNSPVHHPRVGVTGGHKISVSEAPFIASFVRYVNKLPNNETTVAVCGGSVIHEKFILTAAHCVVGDSYRDVVRVGSSKLYAGGITYEVEKFIPHNNFSLEDLSFTYDVALIKLKKSLKFSKTVSKVVLADENVIVKPHTSVNITGWGRTGIKGTVSKELRQVSVKIRPIDDCMVYPWVTDDEICIWSFRKASCKGDSGGPMTLGNVQVGIVSNGLACGYLPSVFAKVSFLLPWIEENINENL